MQLRKPNWLLIALKCRKNCYNQLKVEAFSKQLQVKELHRCSKSQCLKWKQIWRQCQGLSKVKSTIISLQVKAFYHRQTLTIKQALSFSTRQCKIAIKFLRNSKDPKNEFYQKSQSYRSRDTKTSLCHSIATMWTRRFLRFLRVVSLADLNRKKVSVLNPNCICKRVICMMVTMVTKIRTIYFKLSQNRSRRGSEILNLSSQGTQMRTA